MTVRIKNEKILNAFTGEPMKAIYETKKNGKPIPVLDGTGKPLRDQFGNPINETESHDVTTAIGINTFLERAFPGANADKDSVLKPPTMSDLRHAMKVLDALSKFKLFDVAMVDRQPDVIALDQDDYDWLKTAFEQRGVAIGWGLHAQRYIDSLLNVKKKDSEPKNRVNEIASKRNGGSEKDKSEAAEAETVA